MAQLKKLWSKYKSLKWWQQILLALPLIIGAILCILFMFVPSSDDKKFENAVGYHKDYVDKQVKESINADKKLAAKDKKLEIIQKNLQKEIERNGKEAANLIDRIDTATSNNNADELKRIMSELNAASRKRKS